MLLDGKGTILYATPATSRICGGEARELPGRSILDLIDPADAGAVRELLDDFTRHGAVERSTELRCPGPGGSRKILQAAWVNRLADPAIAAIVGTFRDLTDSKRTVALQSALFRIAAKASSIGEMSEFYASIHAIVNELLDAKNFYIALYDPSQDLLTFPYFVDQSDPSPSPIRPGKSLTALVLRSGQPLFVTEETFNEMAARGEVDLVGAPSADWLGVPLKIGEKTIGVLAVQSYVPTTRYIESEKAVLMFVSQHVAAALEHRRAVEALRVSEERYRQLSERNQHLAFHDPLTGLPNRALLNDRLELALAGARREKSGLAVLFLDLDRFKEVNDSLGHRAGDELLQAVAQRLQLCVREQDTIARVGGDEFVLILNGIANPSDAVRVAEKLLRAVREQVFRVGETEVRASASVGISVFPGHGDDPDSLIRIADDAMYAVKAAGRDGIRVGSPE